MSELRVGDFARIVYGEAPEMSGEIVTILSDPYLVRQIRDASGRIMEVDAEALQPLEASVLGPQEDTPPV